MKKSAKVLIIVASAVAFVAVVLSVLFFAFTAVDPGVAPTCGSAGLTEGKHHLLFGYTIEKQEELPALGHDLVHHEGKDPGCTETGFEPYDTCSRCGYSTYTEIPALGHALDHFEGKEPDCENGGHEPYDKCSRCGYTTEYRELPALGHALDLYKGQDATCEAAGFKDYETCSRCGYSNYEVIPALGHDIVHHEGNDPTCTESGFYAYDTCSRCDYSTYEYYPALGHDFEGYACTRCGLDYAVYCNVGTKSTAKVSNDNVGYSFYRTQKDTGPYSDMNCGPTCIYMAGKWADPGFSVQVADIRNIHKNGGGGWTPEDIYTASVSLGLEAGYYYIEGPSDSYNSKTIKDLMKFIDEGKVAIVLFTTGHITSDEFCQSIIGRGYNMGSYGHFVLVKGYWIFDGKTYFELYDPEPVLSERVNPILGNDKTRYHDAMQLMTSSFKRGATMVVISKKTEYVPAATPVTTPAVTPTTGKIYAREGDYVYFGNYPQSEVTDEILKKELSYYAGPTSGWTSYGEYIDTRKTDFIFYKDVTYNGERYRGVFFKRYRQYKASSDVDDGSSRYGYKSYTVYWFKFEPVKWKVLSEQNGEVFLAADLILDAMDFHYRENYELVTNTNDYEKSHIRAWLTETFYNTAFTEAEKKYIKTTAVDNGASSTGVEGNPYAKGPTNDKVFLLSYSEVTDANGGFQNDSGRAKKPTAYARARGVFTSDEKWYWFTRSPFYTAEYYEVGSNVWCVTAYGEIHFKSNGYIYGVVPALHLSLTAP